MLNKIRYLLRPAIFVCTALFLSACNQPVENAVRFGLASMPSNLDPLYATDAASSRIGRLLFQKLVDFDDSKMPVPGISNWEKISETHYRFRLNENVKNFHNGDVLSSADVKATYEFVLDKNNASPHGAALNMIELIETPDASSIDFFLSRADPLFPAYLVIGIVPKKLIQQKHAFGKQPVGSGEFKFVNRSEEGKINLLRLRDNLKLQFIHVPKPTVRVLKLMRGEIDIIQNDLLPELITYLNDNDEVEIHQIKGSNFKYIGFNMEDPVLKHIEVRQAIAYGINRQEIIQYVYGDTAREATALLPPDHWAGNPALKSYAHDPEKAKSLLKKLGYGPSNPLPLTYKTSSDPFGLRLATIYQNQLAQVGIEMDIRSYDWGTFYGDIKQGRFQLYSLAWIGIKTPDIFRYTSHSDAIPPKGANRGRYIDKEADNLIEKAESYADLNQQANYYRQLQAHLLEQLPYVPLWYEDQVVIIRNNVKQYSISADGNYDGLKTVKLAGSI